MLFLAFITFGNAFAQELDLLGVSYFNYPKTDIEEGANNQQAFAQEFGIFGNLPIKLNGDKTIMLNGLTYAFVENTTYNPPEEYFDTKEQVRKLHTISYSMTLVQKLSDTWKLIVILEPTLASDFKDKLSSDDLILQSGLVVTKKFSDNFQLGGGLIYSTHLGEPLPMPALQIKYTYKNHELTGFLPMKAQYSYKFGKEEKLKIGLRAAINGSNFNITSPDFAGVIPSPINKVRYSRANVGPFINYGITDMFRVEIFGGITTGRKYEFIDFEDNEYNYNRSNGPFFNIGFVIVPPSLNK
jgi:hypothetical protein